MENEEEYCVNYFGHSLKMPKLVWESYRSSEKMELRR